MPLKSPNLDDRTYKDIVEEIRSLIPRYAPEWTDWNEHDPGITLIQLFSHLTEMIIYRLNQVPDKNRIEFLKLIGMELKPAQPAKAHLTFALSEDATTSVDIQSGTAVETESSGEEPIIFETDEPLIAIAATLKGVQSYDGNNFSNVTGANDNDGQSYYPFGRTVRTGSTLYLGFSSKLPDEEIRVRVEILSRDTQSVGSHCNLGAGQIRPPAELVWGYWNGKWEELDIIEDETRNFMGSGYLSFKGPSDIKESKLGELTGKDDALYWIRCRVKKSEYEFSPTVETILLNTVPATNAVTVKGEIIGSSDGSPGQLFTLKKIPVLSGSLVLEVDEGEDWVGWKKVDEFHASTRHDQHYTLNRITGEVTFGDGFNGKIPFAGESNIRATYRYGGGKNGNVGAGTITSLQSTLSDVEEVTNIKAATGGVDEETLDKAKERVPQELKTRHRAVTSEDFEFLAIETPEMRIRRAKALPLHHPKFSYDLKIPGVVTVIIVPYSENKKPIPSDGMIRTVCEHLNKHRLLTTEVYVVSPKYKKVEIKAEITVDNRVALGQVKNDVKQKLDRFYHPLTGGIQGTGWPFGGDIYFSEAYRVILEDPRVRRIDNLDIYVDDEKQAHCNNVEIPDHYLVYSDGHHINATARGGE